MSALAELRERRSISKRPHFSVVTVEVKKVTDSKRQKKKVRIIQVRLVDGDDCQIHCQLAPHIMALGRNLKRGDIIRLDNFTELRYHVNEASPNISALFIHAFAQVGCRELSDIIQGNCNILACSKSLPQEHMDVTTPQSDQIIDPRDHSKPVCNDHNRICAWYGVRLFGCICDVLPVKDRNLVTIQQYCYFATDDLDEMSNSHKRNMVSWWYAANVYGITGKGHIGKMPECLEYDIRKAYPNPDGVLHTDCRKSNLSFT